MHNLRDLRVDIRSLLKLLMVVSMGTLLGGCCPQVQGCYLDHPGRHI